MIHAAVKFLGHGSGPEILADLAVLLAAAMSTYLLRRIHKFIHEMQREAGSTDERADPDAEEGGMGPTV